MDIIAATQNAGSNKVYTKGEQEYEAQTVENMRADVLKRAKQTLKALKVYEGGALNVTVRSDRSAAARWCRLVSTKDSGHYGA